MTKWLALLVVLSSAALAPTAYAEDLVIGSAYKAISLDPYFTSVNDSNSILSHIYDRLIWQDESLTLRPALAESWKLVDPTDWEVTLRPDAKFHDGSAVTSEDVAFTVDRIRHTTSGVDPFTDKVAHIVRIEAETSRVFRIVTDVAYPQLPIDLASFFIVSHASPADASKQIGSGPYIIDSFVPGDRVRLHANKEYWGGPPPWDHVDLRAIPAETSRVVALLSGDVDVIDYVPPRDLDRIKAKGLSVVSIPAPRSNFIEFDQVREVTPDVTDAAGHPIANPFRDKRVRLALSLAIDRDVIVQRILGGYATAAAQLFPPRFAGASTKLVPPHADPVGARQLLAEAGYPNGFSVTLHGTADRYPGDSATLQAVAQMWTRIGVITHPVPLPWSVYSAARNHGDYSAYYAGASGADIGETIVSTLYTPNAARGQGAQNLGGYSNPLVDQAITKARLEFDPDQRNALFAAATEMAMADQPIIPLYHYHNIWAFSAKLGAFRAHPRGWTTAMQAAPASTSK